MARPRRSTPEPNDNDDGDDEDELPVAPIARAGSSSELDEYIHLGEEKPAPNDVFADMPEAVEEEEDDSAPIPRIARDEKLEAEIEREKSIPLDELVKDVPIGSLDPVRMYLSDIGKHPLLTGEEEIELAKAIAEGLAAQERYIARLLALEEANLKDEGIEGDALAKLLAEYNTQLRSREIDARRRLDDDQLDADELAELTLIAKGKDAHDKLANSNLRLVVSVAKRYIGRGLNFLDLIQEGNLGLLRAVDKFDHSLGFKFSTYAMWWIRQATSRAIADQARTIRIPVHMVETINRQARAERTLQQELGREPTPEELALQMEFVEADDVPAVRAALKKGTVPQLDIEMRRRLDRASEKVRRIKRLSQEPLSLQTPVGNEENSSLGDFIEDDSLPGPVDSASRRLLREQMGEILDGLNDREKKVLIMRFGLEDGIPRTLEDVGKEFNVTRERVRQIEAKALRKLRHPQRSRKLRDYL